MTDATQTTFVPIGRILAGQVLPGFQRAQKLPLRVSCLGTVSYAAATEADRRERSVSLGEAASPEDAVALAAVRVAQGDIRGGEDDTLRFRSRMIVIQDSALSLVLAGEIRVGIILWQRPVASDGEPDMADYFTHFSCLLDVGTPENASRALELYNQLSEEGASEEPPSDSFLLSIQPEHGGTKLWMRDDVTGDPERLIQFVKRCAAAFGLTGRWGFQYANTCSRPRLDGFGGACARSRHRRDRRLDLYRRLACRGAGWR